MVQVKCTFWILIAALLVLVACGRQEAAQASEVVAEAPSATDAGGLPPVTELALGTLRLEGTGNAVGVEQATELLPLWKMLQSGALQAEAESKTIVKQIEGKMAAEQLAAIDGMDLTVEDMRAWMEEQGLAMGPPDGDPGAPSDQAPGAPQNLSEEERAKMREEFSSLSAEERATRMASHPTEAQGIQPPEGSPPQGGGMGARPGGAGQQANVLLGPLVELLTERSAG